MDTNPPLERPLSLEEGLNATRERRWGWIGGVVGSLVGTLLMILAGVILFTRVLALVCGPS